MRILLLQPPRRPPRSQRVVGALGSTDTGQTLPPLGLAYLAASLERAGHQVRLLDARVLCLGAAQVISEILTFKPDLLGLTGLTPTLDTAAEILRQARPHLRWLAMGGPHPSAVGARIFDELPELDLSFEGEAEESLPRAIDWLASPSGDPPPGLRLPGLPFRVAPAPEISGLPRPAWHLLPRARYRYLLATRPGLATMISSRGCPFSCTFCDKGVSGSTWRAREPQDVVEEMQEHARAGAGFVAFFDDCFTLDPDRVEEICREILLRKLDLEWKCEARVEQLPLELLRTMRRAGCRMIAMGVESMNASSLALLGKSQTPSQIERAFRDARRAGMETLAYVILGSPGEDEAMVRESVRRVEALRPDFVQYSTLALYPGSALAREFQQGTSILEGPRSALDSDHARLSLSDLPPATLDALMRRAWTDFYLRPSPILRVGQQVWRSGAWREALRALRAGALWRLRAEQIPIVGRTLSARLENLNP